MLGIWSFQTLIRLIDDGLGATVLPALIADSLPKARQRAQLRPLVGPTPAREIGLVRARRDLRRGVSEVLISHIRAGLTPALSSVPKGTVVLDPL